MEDHFLEIVGLDSELGLRMGDFLVLLAVWRNAASLGCGRVFYRTTVKVNWLFLDVTIVIV